MKFATKILTALSSLANAEIVPLTDANYVQAQSDYDYMLVSFCDGSEACASLKTELEKANDILSTRVPQNIIATVDVTVEKKLKERFEADHLPMIYEISRKADGKSLYYPYHGEFTGVKMAEEVILRTGKRS